MRPSDGSQTCQKTARPRPWPEHFHALIWPTAQANPSQIVQKLEDRTALLILKNLKENLSYPWC
jgi:REP element-mobilizing transposase RayT